MDKISYKDLIIELNTLFSYSTYPFQYTRALNPRVFAIISKWASKPLFTFFLDILWYTHWFAYTHPSTSILLYLDLTYMYFAWIVNHPHPAVLRFSPRSTNTQKSLYPHVMVYTIVRFFDWAGYSRRLSTQVCTHSTAGCEIFKYWDFIHNQRYDFPLKSAFIHNQGYKISCKKSGNHQRTTG